MKIINFLKFRILNDGIFIREKSDATFHQKSDWKSARIVGISILLMAVITGFSFPVLGTLTGRIGFSCVFLLDILVSFGILKYHKKQKPVLAKTSSLLRLLYTGILGVAVAYLLGGSLPMFNKIWGAGLISFGLHLITLGFLFNNNEGKKWINLIIKLLLIIAGIGYVILHLGTLLVPNPKLFGELIESIFLIPMIFGEVFYALWMLLIGGKQNN